MLHGYGNSTLGVSYMHELSWQVCQVKVGLLYINVCRSLAAEARGCGDEVLEHRACGQQNLVLSHKHNAKKLVRDDGLSTQ